MYSWAGREGVGLNSPEGRYLEKIRYTKNIFNDNQLAALKAVKH
jgi:hypothetical protein